jgi:hypothetical protein
VKFLLARSPELNVDRELWRHTLEALVLPVGKDDFSSNEMRGAGWAKLKGTKGARNWVGYLGAKNCITQISDLLHLAILQHKRR